MACPCLGKFLRTVDGNENDQVMADMIAGNSLQLCQSLDRGRADSSLGIGHQGNVLGNVVPLLGVTTVNIR